jgi:hypothetical protein
MRTKDRKSTVEVVLVIEVHLPGRIFYIQVPTLNKTPRSNKKNQRISKRKKKKLRIIKMAWVCLIKKINLLMLINWFKN